MKLIWKEPGRKFNGNLKHNWWEIKESKDNKVRERVFEIFSS